jgi:uncharacterized protein YneF (UPF0154 family)
MLHLLYIPVVFVIGLALGYFWGAAAAKKAIEKARDELRR